MTRGWMDGGSEEQCSRGAEPGPAPRSGQCKNNNCKRANCCTFLPRGAAVHVDGANGEWHSVCVCVCRVFVYVCLECVCVRVCTFPCMCVIMSCLNAIISTAICPAWPPVTWPPIPPEGSAVSACLLRRVLCVWRPTDCQLAFIYVWLTCLAPCTAKCLCVAACHAGDTPLILPYSPPSCHTLQRHRV